MSSVINFFKNKIKKCTSNKSQTETSAAAAAAASGGANSRSTSLNHTSQLAGHFKAKKRTKNLFNLKLKKNTNSNTIQQYITSEIVILSSDYSMSPMASRSSGNSHAEHTPSHAVADFQLTTIVESDSALSASCVSPYSKINSNISELSSSSQYISNEWSNRSETHLMNASSKNYFLHEECDENINTTDSESMVTYNSKYVLDNDTPNSFAGELTPSRKNSLLFRRHSKFSQENVLNRSLSTQDDLCGPNAMTSALPSRSTNVSKRKCRRSNTTAAAPPHHQTNPKSNSIIDYFNRLELINPVRKKQRKSQLNRSATGERDADDKQSAKVLMPDDSASLLNNTVETKNEMEKIQDLFFEDDDDDSRSNLSDEFNSCFNTKEKLMALSSYMDSPVSSVGSACNGLATTPVPMVQPLDEEDQEQDSASNKSNESFFNHVPSSSPASVELDFDERKSNGKTCNNSIEKLRRSISTPGLKDINSSIFSNISHIQIKECDSVDDTDINNNKDTNPYEKTSDMDALDSNKQAPVQFVRGSKARSSKNIKQLFKNVVKYQMNALNSLEKFYESQLNKLEADRRQNLKLNSVYADKINAFYDRQLELLEERVQSNLTLICENKRNRLSTASSSSAIAAVANVNVNYSSGVNSYLMKKNSPIDAKKVAKINTNDLKQPRPVNSKILNDLKLNLKNQNTLLPSKSLHQLKQTDLNESQPMPVGTSASPVITGKPPVVPALLAFRQLRRGDCDNETDEHYSIAKFRSPKLPALAYTNTNKFYKKQSILQSPQLNDHSVDNNIEAMATPLASKFQYQKNKIKRYSTSNENLAQITKVHHVKNSLARIVKLNRSEMVCREQKTKRGLGDEFKHFKKHQSVCSLEPTCDEFDFLGKTTIVNEKIKHFMCSTDFRTIDDESMFDCDYYPIEVSQHVQPSRLSDSHLLYEMRQQSQHKKSEEGKRMYQKKMSKSFLYETKV